MSLLISILLMLIVITIHEFGHYAALRYYDIVPKEFSIGIDRELWSRRWRGTRFVLRLIPFGGSVSSQDQPLGRRRKDIVLLAGIAMNSLVAFVLMTMIFLISGGLPPAFNFLGVNSFQALLIAAPLVSLVMVVVFTVCLPLIIIYSTLCFLLSPLIALPTIAGYFSRMPDASGMGVIGYYFISLLWLIAIYNLVIAGFNLLPLGPLDGGQIADAHLRLNGYRRRADRWKEIGNWICIGLFIALMFGDAGRILFP